MQDLDEQVLEHLGSRLCTIERMAQIVRHLSKELAALRQSNSARHAEIQAQLNEVRQRIRRQYEVIESGDIEMALVAPRLRELKEIEDGLVESLTEAAGPAQVPPYLFKESALQAIHDNLKSAFLSPDTGIAKRYVNHILERIEVAGDEVRLDARMANVLTIEAQKRKDGTVNHEGQAVPSIVLNWLPDVDECGNFLEIILFSLPSPLADTERALSRKPKSSLKSAIEQAFEFQRLLDERVVNSQAEIAVRYGISRARVTQVLNLLRLSEAALTLLDEVVADLGCTYTERRLRPILRLPTEAGQLAAIERIRNGVISSPERP